MAQLNMPHFSQTPSLMSKSETSSHAYDQLFKNKRIKKSDKTKKQNKQPQTKLKHIRIHT